MAKRRKKRRKTKTTKRRTTKKRATKKRTTKKRTGKKRTAKKRTAKKRTTKKRTTKRRTAKKATRKKRRGGSAQFMAPVQPSGALAAVVGSRAMPRTQIVKKLWAYIRKNRLQDKSNKRVIIADAKLKSVFGGKNRVTMFEMMKHVKRNVK